VRTRPENGSGHVLRDAEAPWPPRVPVSGAEEAPRVFGARQPAYPVRCSAGPKPAELCVPIERE
jgi:hypothetical protein